MGKLYSDIKILESKTRIQVISDNKCKPYVDAS